MRQRAERQKEQGAEGGQRVTGEFTSSESLQVCARLRLCVFFCVPTRAATRGRVCVCMNERKGRRQQKRQRTSKCVSERRAISHQ